MRLIGECSEGIPRNISNLCFNALSLGCALQARTIDVGIVQQVLADFDLTMLRADHGIVNFRPESISLAEAMDESRSPATPTAQVTMQTPSGQALNSKEALAYLQEIVQRLKSNQNLAN
jgi:hypothetical protein